MTIATPSRSSRLVSYGVLVASAGLLSGVLLLIFDVLYNLHREARDEAQTKFESYRDVIATRPQWESAIQQAKSQQAGISGLIHAQNATQAAAQMQNAVRAIAAKNSGDLRSVQFLSGSRVNSFEKISVRYDVVIPIDHLKLFLYGIETESPYIFIDDFRMELPEHLQNDADKTPNVEINWIGHAYRWEQK